MSVGRIEAAVERVVQQLSSDQKVQQDAKAAFLELLDQVVNKLGANTTAAAPANRAASMPFLTSTGTGAVAHGYGSTRGSSSMTSSLLLDPTLPSLEQLPDTLTAEDEQYNQREVVLRERLDISALERRLRSSAQSYGIEYHVSDLEGVLRNAGYGAAHLGSSDRYMAAIEKFMGYAEENYSQRASNVPGKA
jgi:hypothetical protein